MDRAALEDWVAVIDELSYYAIFSLREDATADDIKHAFHAFADAFHPDAHAARPDDERAMVAHVFKRANEAYRVLSDPGLRERYDAKRTSSMPPSLQPPSSMRESAPPRRLEDQVRSPSARPFARRAEELVKQGDVRQAKLQLVMARHLEPGNDALEAYLRHIEAELVERGKK